MPSNRTGLKGGPSGQRGIGLVEVVVASALMGVALMVLLSNLSTVVIGGRVAERRVVEERLARNQLEGVMQAAIGPCPSPMSQSVDKIAYAITVACAVQPHLVEYKVTVAQKSDATAKLDLFADRWTP
jgi:type II secretory pathway pseudopilin PulG